MRQLFLPGAGGSAGFWKPLAERLPGGAERRFFAWPGLGDEPPDPAVRGIDDLVAMVTDALDAAVITSYSIHYTKLYESAISLEIPVDRARPNAWCFV